MAALNIREPVSEAIEAHYERSQSPSDHPTLRASEIGDECERRLWYRLRWALPPKRWTGRMLRLFATGHGQEDRIVADLRAIGVTVTCQQERIEDLAGGALTGSIDGEGLGVPGAEKTAHLLECKTHNEANFKALLRAGVKKAMPKHYAQCQVYMRGRGLKRALYAAVNKNTDELYCERVESDPVAASQIEAKAMRIHAATVAPPRLSDKPDFWECMLCDFHELCHGEARARTTCRTCLHGSLQLGGELACDRHLLTIGLAGQAKGCPNHLYLPSLIHGDQIDADESRETVTYRLRDGSIYVDGGSNAGR